jgi:hypothetical protein
MLAQKLLPMAGVIVSAPLRPMTAIHGPSPSSGDFCAYCASR